MRLISVSENECKFQNTVLQEMNFNFIMKILSSSIRRLFCENHNEEETPLFYQNLEYERTFKRNED